MKAVLIISVLLAFFAGCSKGLVNPVSPIAKQELTVQLGFAIDQGGVMAKKAVLAKLAKTAVSNVIDTSDFVPAYFVVFVHNLRSDTIFTSRPDTVKASYRFEKNSSHTIEGMVFNSKKIGLNWGMTTFTVPSTDTSFTLVCASEATELHLKIPLNGTSAKSSAYSFKVVSTLHQAGGAGPYADSNQVSFTTGTLDTVNLLGFLFPGYGYTIAVTGYCNDGTSQYTYQGSADISMISPSAAYSITIALTKYGSGGSLGKVTFTISPNGRVDAIVTFT
jgi:hypothetical protein